MIGEFAKYSLKNYAHDYSGAPAAEGRQAEPHTHRKVKETHELIFSWLSWLAVLLTGAYDDDGDDSGVEQHSGYTPNRDMQPWFTMYFFDK